MFKHNHTHKHVHNHLTHRDFIASKENHIPKEDNYSICKIFLSELKKNTGIIFTLIGGVSAGAVGGYFLLGNWGILFGGITTFFTAASICRMISLIRDQKNEAPRYRIHSARKIKAEIGNIICTISSVAIGYFIGSWWSLVISTAIGLFIGKTIVDAAASRRHYCHRKEY